MRFAIVCIALALVAFPDAPRAEGARGTRARLADVSGDTLLILALAARHASARFRWTPSSPADHGWSTDLPIDENVHICLDCGPRVVGLDGVLDVTAVSVMRVEHVLTMTFRDGFVVESSMPVERADEIRIRREVGTALGCNFGRSRGASVRRERVLTDVEWGAPRPASASASSRVVPLAVVVLALFSVAVAVRRRPRRRPTLVP